MMRRFSSTAAFVAAGTLAWSCAVYDSGLVPNNDSLITNGGEGPSSSGTSSTSNAGSGNTAAGSIGTTGGTSSGQAGSVNGGTNPLAEGGAGGEAPTVTSGSGGAAGVGGAAGAAGKGGSGGTTGTAGTAGKAGSGGTSGAAGSGGSAGKGGSGGSAGSVAGVKCADNPITAKTKWVASASSSSLGTGVESDGLYNPPLHMTDGSFTERWSSGKSQSGDEWIEIDFSATVTLTQLTLSGQSDPGDFPRAYAVRISSKSQDFAAAVKASGTGANGDTIVTFAAPITGRYLTVRQTGMDVAPDTAWWTITEVLATCTN